MYNQKYTATGFRMHNCDNCSIISHVKHSGPSTRNSFAEKIENVSSYFFIKKTPMEFLLIPISKEKWLTSVQSLPHLSTSVAWRVKMFKCFFFYKYFCLVLGLLKSRVSKKSVEGLGRKLDFKHFHYKVGKQNHSYKYKKQVFDVKIIVFNLFPMTT